MPNDTKVKSISYNASSSNFYCKVDAPFLISADSINFYDSIAPMMTTGTIFIKASIQNQDSIYKGRIITVFPNKDTAIAKPLVLAHTYHADSVYTLASWNIKWMGDASNCSCDITIQRNNVIQFLKELQPEIVALQEIVNDVALNTTVTAGLGANFGSTVSTFGSFADNITDIDYPDCQKLSYIYNKDLFRLNFAYPFSKTYNQNIVNTSSIFSSGRFPYAANFTFATDGSQLNIFNLHAKAGDGNSDFNRRLQGANVIRDSNDVRYKNDRLIVIGDFNDYLEGTISTNSFSPYQFMQNANMTGISKPSRYPKLNSYAFNSGIIDNLCANTKAMQDFTGSFTIFEEMGNIFDNYKYTTSDHYPIFSIWKKPKQIFSTHISSNDKIVEIKKDLHELNISNPNQMFLQIRIFNIMGQLMYQTSTMQPFYYQKNEMDLLLVEISGEGKRQVIKW